MTIKNARTPQKKTDRVVGEAPVAAKASPAAKRFSPWRITKGTIARLLLMTVIVSLIAGWERDRMSPSTWGVPLQYTSDSLQVLGWIQGAADLDYLPFASKIIHRLGAPYPANWNDLPMYEEILTFVLGLAARWFGLMQASNLGLLMSYVPSALAFYGCCRMLRYARLWSFVGALLFAFTFYNWRRHLFHLFLSFSYVIPLALVTSWLVLASKRLRLGGREFWFCVITSFVMGLSNPYSLNVFLQLLGFSIVLNWWRYRDIMRFKVGAICIAAAVTGFISVNLDTLGYAYAHGSNPAAVTRNYAQNEMNALKPMEMIVPPSEHNSKLLSEMGKKYVALAPIKGEVFSPYLGIVGMVSLVWLTAEFLWFLLNPADNIKRRVPAYFLQSGWIMAYSVIGGINCLIALGGFYLFRSTNRYSIFISGICMFFFVSRMTLLTRQWQPAARWAAALAITILGLFDQLPKSTTRAETVTTSKLVENDASFCSAMEKALPRGGMVFELPVMPFPEAGSIQAMGDYEPLRPFFFTKQLRFSYGSNKGRPRDDWQWIVEKMAPSEMVTTLEKYGFSAIYLNRKGFADGAESLLKSVAALGKTNVIEDAKREQACVLLNPSPSPQMPHTDDRALINYKHGWVAEESLPDQVRHWSDRNATVGFFNEHKTGTPYHITGIIAALSARKVSIEFEGRNIWEREIGTGQGAPVDIWITAKSRNNRLYFRTDTPAANPQQGGLAVAFAAINLQITKGQTTP
jgi:hypothetical protein